MFHLHLVAYTERSVQAAFVLLFHPNFGVAFTSLHVITPAKRGGFEELKRLAFLVHITETVTSAMSEGTGNSSVTVQSQSVRSQAEERSSCISPPGIWRPLLWCHQKIIGFCHAPP